MGGQRRERLTAQALADELGVSVRTIYRDLDALSAAGIPVYAERGPGGGCRLLENYRTTLTGLTQDETSSLLMLGMPEPLGALAAGQKLKSALLKLYAAMPPGPVPEGRAPARIHLDWAWWSQWREPVPHLQALYEAVGLCAQLEAEFLPYRVTALASPAALAVLAARAARHARPGAARAVLRIAFQCAHPSARARRGRRSDRAHRAAREPARLCAAGDRAPCRRWLSQP